MMSAQTALASEQKRSIYYGIGPTWRVVYLMLAMVLLLYCIISISFGLLIYDSQSIRYQACIAGLNANSTATDASGHGVATCAAVKPAWYQPWSNIAIALLLFVAAIISYWRHQARLIISPAGIESRRGYYSLITDWKNIESIEQFEQKTLNLRQPMHRLILHDRAEIKGIASRFVAGTAARTISLSSWQWQSAKLKADLKRYGKNLIIKEG